MISFIETTYVTGRSVVATCPLGSPILGTGVSGPGLASGVAAVRPTAPATALPIRERGGRPIQASAAAATAQAHAYAFAATNGAESLKQLDRTQHAMWAYRGLEPWRDPT